MSDEPKIQQLYPGNADDLESEKEILDAIVKVQPLEIQFKLLAINSNLLKLKNLESNEQAEIAAKDAETARKFQTNCATINGIIAGTHKLADDELANIEKYLTPEELAKKDELLSKLAPLSDYWLKCMQNHGVLKSAMNEETDVEALKHLTGVEYKLSEDPKTPLNFTLTFHFSENPFFTNQTLSVTLHLKEAREATKIVGTEINYKEGKNLTKKVVEKKQKNKKTGQTRTIKKEEDTDSFFLLFKTIEHDHEAHAGKEDEEDEEHDKIHEELYDHCEWAYAFYEEVIPYSPEYYLGLRKDEGEDDEDYEDEDGDDDDDDEDEDDHKGKKKPAAKPTTIGGDKKGGDEKKPECKQQ